MTSAPVAVTTTSSRFAPHNTVGTGPVSFERKHHALFELFGVVERNQTGKDRFFPNRQTHAVTVLQSKSCFLVGEPKFFRLGPDLHNVRRRRTGLYKRNRPIHIFPGNPVGIALGPGR